MAIFAYKDSRPDISERAFIAPSADIIGDVKIEADSGVWFNCVIRADVAFVRIGKGTNIQDGTVVHVTRNGHPTRIGDGVTVGHNATLHACTLEELCFIGMGATVMDDAVVETGAMLAAGALLAPGKRVPAGQIWAGNPAKFFRDMTEDEKKHIAVSRDNYIVHAREYILAGQDARDYNNRHNTALHD